MDGAEPEQEADAGLPTEGVELPETAGDPVQSASSPVIPRLDDSAQTGPSAELSVRDRVVPVPVTTPLTDAPGSAGQVIGRDFTPPAGALETPAGRLRRAHPHHWCSAASEVPSSYTRTLLSVRGTLSSV